MAIRDGYLAVVPGYMVRDKINYKLESCIMCPLDQLLKLRYSILWIISKIRIDVIIIADCVWGTCLTLYELRVRRNASTLRGLRRMPQNTSVPYVTAAQPLDVVESS